MCQPYDYGCMKRMCNATPGAYSPICLEYFLSLPRGDLGIIENRQNFAESRCNNPDQFGYRECRLLCQDTPAVCRDQRADACRGLTLSDIESGNIPSTSPMATAPPDVQKSCACYLERSQYELVFARLAERLGQAVVDKLRTSQFVPQCFYSNCSASDIGRDTQLSGCESVDACLQSVTVEKDQPATVINVCDVGAVITVLPCPSMEGLADWSWIFYLILGSVIVIIVISVLVLIFARKPVEEEYYLLPIPV